MRLLVIFGFIFFFPLGSSQNWAEKEDSVAADIVRLQGGRE